MRLKRLSITFISQNFSILILIIFTLKVVSEIYFQVEILDNIGLLIGQILRGYRAYLFDQYAAIAFNWKRNIR